jgi:hypothetical protein
LPSFGTRYWREQKGYVVNDDGESHSDAGANGEHEKAGKRSYQPPRLILIGRVTDLLAGARSVGTVVDVAGVDGNVGFKA